MPWGAYPTRSQIVDDKGIPIYELPDGPLTVELVSAQYEFNNDPEDDGPVDVLVMTYRLVT